LKKNTLYFFTASFPFSKGETFIETEVKYLSDAFEIIYIIPLFAYSTDNYRNVPENCIVLNPIIRNRWQHYFLGLFGVKTLKIYLLDLIINKVYKNKYWLKDLIADFCTTNNIFQSKPLSKLLKSATENDIFYFYWGKGLANIVPFTSNIKSKTIVRFHGGDLYDCNYGGYLPIHKNIIKGADLSVFISKHGQTYLTKRYPDICINSVVSYLGTEDFGVSKRSDDGTFRLLSCSNVIPLKRVHLIYETIQSISNYSVEWTHIGDGQEFELLQKKTSCSRNNVKINLLGRLSNKNVIDYYQNNCVDAFINVSSTEGLPVSIMEAISFNIPVIGTDVGGTSEIVCAETGVLLSANPNCYEILQAIESVRLTNFQPRLYWKKNFSAKTNYENFTKAILSLNSDNDKKIKL
jgi:colanic acid/amylovoran biosynthesis glycosyltransferase